MRKNRTQSIEDYLKAIYEISSKNDRASTTALSDYLKVTPASVTGMIKKLSVAEIPLVEYQKHHGVVLTPAGKNIALETLRHHRLIELFLHEILGYPWDEVHEEADRLEHVISEKFEERIAAALGHPQHDPHGDPIPNLDLTLPNTSTLCLNKLRTGDKAIIRRVRDTDPDLLRYLSDKGITPEARISIIDYSEFDDNLHVQVKNQDEITVLGSRISTEIFVEIIN